MLSDQRITEMKSRIDAATPGPWSWDECPQHDRAWGKAMYALGWFDNGTPVSIILPDTVDSVDHETWSLLFVVPDDADFIAHAREDLPDALAEIERLKAENDDLRRQVADYRRYAAMVDDWFDDSNK
jgi:hypothetical protein